MKKFAAVILAAGQGTRMRSDLPKVLHCIAGKPMLQYSLDLVDGVTDQSPVVVIGHKGEEVQKVVGEQARFVVQHEQLGTGHAVQTAESILKDETDYVLVLNADLPLILRDSIVRLLELQRQNSTPIAMLTVLSDDPRGFGRIVRHADGGVERIVEETDATPQEKLINELNVGVYCFRANWLWDALREVTPSAKGEYYLTDLVEIATQQGEKVQAVVATHPDEAIGINNRVHLAEAETVMRKRINQGWMECGVTFIDPSSTYIELGVEIGRDSIIYPNTVLRGYTKIGHHTHVGPNSMLLDTKVGNHCMILQSVLEHAVLEDYVEMGPFGHLRKGAYLADHVHMGNFGEIKNSYLGKGSKMGHFSYMGDAEVGENVNIGAGTITCNYDGKNKNKTVIGSNAFIGSDTMLVAPVSIGERSITGAGSVVNRDVPADTVVIGVPAKEMRKKDA
ncbi:MAG: bifunctional UDP-N-acetylglucosamine diphosphorylase/glucosamine-1-phosphate N-acetyltransferase GlmU [Anaerolineaceae bacterium]|nr:bifunctional UDP-N-acetylglucosamine diphosphorylase/glucosamine-1-phosphate N-acetyltransferase GlmU [Anaerolineaceae bacterium]